MPTTADYTYTYTGPQYQETRKFNLQRGNVLKAVFAGEKWGDIIRNINASQEKDKKRFDGLDCLWDEDLAGQTTDVERKVVKIDIQAGPTLWGGYYRRKSTPETGGIVAVFFSGSGGPAKCYVLPVLLGYLTNPALKNYIEGVLTVDYRGFGMSREGGPDSMPRSSQYEPQGDYLPGSRALYTDASAMIAFLNDSPENGGLGIPGYRILLHGFSLGSGPATEMSKAGKPHCGLVLHGPMQSVKDVANREGGFLGKIKIAGAVADGNVGFRNYDKIPDIQVPVLVTSGPKDSMWPDAKNLRAKLQKEGKKSFFCRALSGTYACQRAVHRYFRGRCGGAS